jgi:glutathione synthase/RimK-type ligase-like ATP-grasp enzyme
MDQGRIFNTVKDNFENRHENIKNTWAVKIITRKFYICKKGCIMHKILGITSSQLAEPGLMTEELGFEIYRLMEEGRKRYHEVILINPATLYFIFKRSNSHPVAMTENADLSELDTLIIRKTIGYEEPLALLARTLISQGCDLLDPPERFSGSPAGKLTESLKGCLRKFSPDTFIAFNRADALRLANKLAAENQFPLIGKPNRGSRGENVCLLQTVTDALLYIDSFFRHEIYSRSALLFQTYVKIEKEYRVMVLDGSCLGMVEKKAREGEIARNAAMGGKFLVTHDQEVIDFTLQHTNSKGIIGVDVLRDATGRLYLLEANRAPQWCSFEKATGINVAACIIEKTWQRALHVNNFVF